MPFLDSLDIANKACQLMGTDEIATITEDSKANKELTFAYDKERRAELRRNTWKFAIRKVVLRPVDTTTMILKPALYASGTTYLPGAIVADANRLLWLTTLVEGNANNKPGANNDVWDRYFGPMTVQPYDATIAYFTGELVYLAGAKKGSYTIFQSLKNINSDYPSTATPYDAAVQYNGSAIVSYGGQQWDSRLEINLGNTPTNYSAQPWDATATYAAGQLAMGSDNIIYTSIGNGNIDHDPVTDGSVNWTNAGLAFGWRLLASDAPASTNWRIINATMENLAFSYPIGTGPSSEMATRNVFRLPAGFLREAPQDPKAGSFSFLGAPSGLQYSDWLYEGDYIVSHFPTPIMLRFVADVTRVSAYDDLFCVGLAAKLAKECCLAITQSSAKLADIRQAYLDAMREARLIDAIERGPTEPPEDDYITCRL